MNTRLLWVLLALAAPWCSTPASAYLDLVTVPETVETGTPFSVYVFGTMPDLCWELLGYEWSAAAQVLTVDISTAFTAPPGTGCPQALLPFEVLAEVTLNEPGSWLLRVVEHRQHPVYQMSDLVVERTVMATGPVALELVNWGTLRARYR